MNVVAHCGMAHYERCGTLWHTVNTVAHCGMAHREHFETSERRWFKFIVVDFVVRTMNRDHQPLSQT